MPFVQLVHRGDFPLYELTARIVDLEKFSSRKTRDYGTLAEALGDEDFVGQILDLGELDPGRSRALGQILPVVGDSGRFNIFFSARNGFFTQVLRLRRVASGWIYATKVTRRDEHGDVVSLFEKVPDSYPRNAGGDVDWE